MTFQPFGDNHMLLTDFNPSSEVAHLLRRVVVAGRRQFRPGVPYSELPRIALLRRSSFHLSNVFPLYAPGKQPPPGP